MTKELTLVEQFQEKLPGFTVMSLRHVNHNPHPFMIGAMHVGWAADNWGGRLGTEAIEDAEKHGIYCAQEGCNLPYSEHKADHVLFLQLKGNLSHEEASKQIKSIADLMSAYDIDGIAFVETEQGYRIS